LLAAAVQEGKMQMKTSVTSWLVQTICQLWEEVAAQLLGHQV